MTTVYDSTSSGDSSFALKTAPSQVAAKPVPKMPENVRLQEENRPPDKHNPRSTLMNRVAPASMCLRAKKAQGRKALSSREIWRKIFPLGIHQPRVLQQPRMLTRSMIAPFEKPLLLCIFPPHHSRCLLAVMPLAVNRCREIRQAR